MSSSTISCRIFGCLLLILLSQYADARKSYYLEILESLQRLESMLVKQPERNTFCLMPTEKLHNLILEHQTSYESNENNIPYLAPRYYITPRKLKLQKKNKNENENMNANINENLNSNIDTKRHHRRSFNGGDSHVPKMRNQNTNSNVNFNSNVNANEAFDFSDEDEV
ncbi:hypothetical protein ALC60_14269 [Trachymyrmex zeteki]|uniref:Uncharacterized protein n=1 Tax=Mycetomoellerius zeteki TaxID=64791 RepID=A0A151WG07_9HYME|nr:hypothetical protein ALC60_14269 [Trachymyrmex zeteki]